MPNRENLNREGTIGLAEASGARMICHGCRLELGIERRAEEVVVTYSYRDWKPAMPSPDDPALCSNLLPTILARLTDDKPVEDKQRDRRCA